jgi:hypothetical protein
MWQLTWFSVCIWKLENEYLVQYTFIPERAGAENKNIFVPKEFFLIIFENLHEF